MCHDCKWEADNGNTKPHECETAGCTCQHELDKGVYINHEAVSKSKTNTEDAVATFSKSN